VHSPDIDANGWPIDPRHPASEAMSATSTNRDGAA
jgi:hypothetical protein